MNKENAIRYLQDHGAQCGYSIHGVWAICHWIHVESGRTGSTIETLRSFQEIREWLGY